MGARFAGLARLLALIAAALAAGCVHYAPLDPSYAGPEPLPASIVAEYAYEPPPLEPRITALKERNAYAVREVLLHPIERAAADNSLAKTIDLEYYDPTGDGPTPVVLLLPILNGNLHVTRYFAHYFAEQGWAALVMGRDREPISLALEHVEQTMERNLLDYRRVLDWIGSNPRFDPKRIAVFGISFGGIDAVILSALDPRVDAVVAGMAGGALPYLFVNTSYRSVARQVSRDIHRKGLSRAQLSTSLAAQVQTDPMRFAPYLDAHKLFMIMTHSDWIIPFEAQQALRRRLGHPQAVVLPTGHRPSVVFFPLIRREAYEFFARRFADEASEGQTAARLRPHPQAPTAPVRSRQ